MKIAPSQLANTHYVSDALLVCVDTHRTFAVNLHFHFIHLDNKDNNVYFIELL